ncbi:MAG: tRNA 2-thiouridine(34) synthase MnmA [Oscillospiraceae bacterium]|nr:tRNA 2-thiouridine(34) synthase MnmA [Oscillospiraceae bacterium]
MTEKALVAMSGGVDSSVAAYLLQQAGYDCTGAMMKLFENEDVGVGWEKGCCSLEDAGDAETVARRLDIPFYIFNYTDDFRTRVMDHFVAEYARGRTPNPCVDCNRHLKFDALLHRADDLGCRYIATGHYARAERDGERVLLKKGLDADKDQSYVLFFLTQTQLARTIFPLGALTKPRVREIAAENGFVNAQKRDSQDICFVRGGDYADFIEQYTGEKLKAGRFVSDQGAELGVHRGIARYTIGQRRGLGVASSDKLYVCGIDASNNTVVLGKNKRTRKKRLTAREINFIPFDRLDSPMRVTARIRYGQAEQPATVFQETEDTFCLEFDESQRAITGGQFAVLYDGDVVVGGGTIDRAEE